MDINEFDNYSIDLPKKIEELEKENINLKKQLDEKDTTINILKTVNNILKETIKKYEKTINQIHKNEILDCLKSNKQEDKNKFDINLLNQNKNIDINDNKINNKSNESNLKIISDSNENNSLPSFFNNDLINSNISQSKNLYPILNEKPKNNIINHNDIIISKIEESLPNQNNINNDNNNNLENLDLLLAMQIQMEMDKEAQQNISNINKPNKNFINNNAKKISIDFNKNDNKDNNNFFQKKYDIIQQFDFIGPNNRYGNNVNRIHPIPRNNERNLMAISKIDKMTYEELLELEKKMGKVSQGLSQEQINQLLFEIYKESNNKEDNICTICKTNFENGEKIRRLGCNHIFHMDCIDPWLLEKKNCPICLNEIKFE